MASGRPRGPCGREGAGLGTPARAGSMDAPRRARTPGAGRRALAPRVLPAWASGPPFRTAVWGRPRPGAARAFERGCRPGWGPARAGRGRAAGRGVSVLAGPAAGSTASSSQRGTRYFRGRSCSLPGASLTQHACQAGPRPDCSHYPKFAFGVRSEATWVVTVLLS